MSFDVLLRDRPLVAILRDVPVVRAVALGPAHGEGTRSGGFPRC